MIFNTVWGGKFSSVEVLCEAGSTVYLTGEGGQRRDAQEQNGRWLFWDVPVGKWTAYAMRNDKWTSEVINIQREKQQFRYTVQLSYFNGYIEVTYPAGSECTCTLGETVMTAEDTSGRYVFHVKAPGSWVVKSQKDGLSAEETVSITTDMERKRVELSYFTATIEVSYPSGSRCTCKKGDLTLTAPDRTGSATFAVHEAGDWVIASTDGTLSKEQTVVIIEDGQRETVALLYMIYIVKDGHVDTEKYSTSGITNDSGGSIRLSGGNGQLDSYIRGVAVPNGFKTLVLDIGKFASYNGWGYISLGDAKLAPGQINVRTEQRLDIQAMAGITSDLRFHTSGCAGNETNYVYNVWLE